MSSLARQECSSGPLCCTEHPPARNDDRVGIAQNRTPHTVCGRAPRTRQIGGAWEVGFGRRIYDPGCRLLPYFTGADFCHLQAISLPNHGICAKTVPHYAARPFQKNNKTAWLTSDGFQRTP